MTIKMRIFFTLLMLFGLSNIGRAQTLETITRSLKPFTKIKTGFNVAVELRPGPDPTVKLNIEGVDPDEVVCKVAGKTLKIYIKGQKLTTKKRYKQARITAVVTYEQLRLIAMKGEEDLRCTGQISSEEFRLRLMGDNEVDLARLEAAYLKGRILGEGKVRIRSGFAIEQAWQLNGGASLELLGLRSEYFWTRALGDCTLELQVHQDLEATLLGEAVLKVKGRPVITQTSIGEVSFYRVD